MGSQANFFSRTQPILGLRPPENPQKGPQAAQIGILALTMATRGVTINEELSPRRPSRDSDPSTRRPFRILTRVRFVPPGF